MSFFSSRIRGQQPRSRSRHILSGVLGDATPSDDRNNRSFYRRRPSVSCARRRTRRRSIIIQLQTPDVGHRRIAFTRAHTHVVNVAPPRVKSNYERVCETYSDDAEIPKRVYASHRYSDTPRAITPPLFVETRFSKFCARSCVCAGTDWARYFLMAQNVEQRI